jgi:hypothetical protein
MIPSSGYPPQKRPDPGRYDLGDDPWPRLVGTGKGLKARMILILAIGGAILDSPGLDR